MNNKKIVLTILLFAVFSCYFCSKLPFVANDFPYVYGKPNIYNLYPHAWSWMGTNGLGYNTISTLWSWPNNLYFFLLQSLTHSFELTTLLWGIIPAITISSLSLWLLLSEYKVNHLGKIASIVFYLLNTYVLMLADGGQLSIVFAYSSIPFVLFMVESFIDTWKYRYAYFIGIAISIVGYYDFRFVLILLGIVTSRIIFELFNRAKLKRSILFIVQIVLVVFLLNIYWIYALVLGGVTTTFSLATGISGLSSAKVFHSLFLQHPNWPNNVFGQINPPQIYFAFVPALAFLSILFNKKKIVIFYFLIGLLFVFLAKGSSPPFGQLYSWTINKIPMMSAYRDSTKFMSGVALSYSILIGLSIDALSRMNRKLGTVISIAFCTFIFVVISPVWRGEMTGALSSPVYKDDHLAVASELEGSQDFFRIVWTPFKQPMSYSSTLHPNIDSLHLVSLRPFASGIVGSYELFNFLRDAPHTGELLDVAGIKYIGYPYPDERRVELKPDNVDYYHYFSDQLDALPWLDRTNDPPVQMFETTNHQDRFFIAPNKHYVVGSDRIYWNLMQIDGFELENNALVFVEESPEVVKVFSDNANIILYRKELIDLAMAQVPSEGFIFPAGQLSHDPDDTGWWKRDSHDLINWRVFLQEKYGIDSLDFDYGGGWAVAEGELRKRFTSERFKEGDVLFARVLMTPDNSQMIVKQGDNEIGTIISTRNDQYDANLTVHGNDEVEDVVYEFRDGLFSWKRVGVLKENGFIDIESSGVLNVIQAFAGVSEEDLDNANASVSENLEEGNIAVIMSEEEKSEGFDELFSSTSDYQVSYEMISPVEYLVTIEGLEKPATLVFSSTFDELWELNGQSSFKVYSFLNGFDVEKDGTYRLYYTPQTYVDLGLKVSVGILIAAGTVAIVYFVIRKRKK